MPDGRLAAGASSHCAHGLGGDALREYLDWRPYEYFTCRLSPIEGADFYIFVDSLETYEFRPVGDGQTEHRWLLRSVDRSPEGMEAFDSAIDLIRQLSADETWGDHMRGPIAEDAAMYGMQS